MAKSAKLRCVILTPQKPVIDTEAVEVVFPAHDGLLGVLPGHAPLLCNLGVGLLQYHDANDKKHYCMIAGGFGHVHDDVVTILANDAAVRGEVTTAQAEEELLLAKTLPSHTPEETESRAAALKRAQCLIRLSKME